MCAFPATLAGMWTPASMEALERATRSGQFLEKERFEAKREVGRNKDVAIDVNAMALDGGAVSTGSPRTRPGGRRSRRPSRRPARADRPSRPLLYAEPPEIDIHDLPRSPERQEQLDATAPVLRYRGLVVAVERSGRQRQVGL